MFPGHNNPRLGLDEIGCFVLSLGGVLAVGWFGWLVAILTFDSDSVSAGAALTLVGFPSFMFSLAVARAKPAHKPAWFLGLFLTLVVASLLLMLLIVSLID